jgi:hypothetical protein
MEKPSRKPLLPLPEPVRNFSARGISALVAPIIRPVFRKRAPAAYQLLADWDALAGPEIAATARPVKLAGGTLTLACSGPTAMDLQYRADMLIKRLNTSLGGTAIERLKFVQETVMITVAPAPKSRKASPSYATSLPDGPLGEALAKLYQGIAGRE